MGDISNSVNTCGSRLNFTLKTSARIASTAAMAIHRPSALRIALARVFALPAPAACGVPVLFTKEALTVLYVYKDAIDSAPATTPTMLMGTRFQYMRAMAENEITRPDMSAGNQDCLIASILPTTQRMAKANPTLITGRKIAMFIANDRTVIAIPMAFAAPTGDVMGSESRANEQSGS